MARELGTSWRADVWKVRYRIRQAHNGRWFIRKLAHDDIEHPRVYISMGFMDVYDSHEECVDILRKLGW